MSYFHEEQRFGRWIWAVLVIASVPVVVAAIGVAGARLPSVRLLGLIVVAVIAAYSPSRGS